jgi:RNA polymerase sigma-70 factor (ECF subfamily)
VARLPGKLTRPDDDAIRVEMKIRLQEALNVMDPLDREVLALRHFEHLSITEAAQVLDIMRAATAKRFVPALEQLRDTLSECPGAPEL